MRAIKFQAWDGEFMWEVRWMDLREGKVILLEGYAVGGSAKGTLHQGEIKALREFTGRTDRDEKDIYEGDIMRTESAGYGRVLMDEKGFWGIKLFNIQGKPVHHLFYHARSGVVIGNVFENKELLDDSK